MSRSIALVAVLLCILGTTAAVDVAPFTSFQQGGSLEGKLVRIRPTSDTPKVEGATPTVSPTGVLSIACPCDDTVDIFAPEATFSQISLSGTQALVLSQRAGYVATPTGEGGLVKVSDHDSEPNTCLAGTFTPPKFTATVSASTNLSLGCIDTQTITIRQTGQSSFISMWWTNTADSIDIINSGEGASTHVLGGVSTVNVQLPGEKATITVRDADAVITGTSVGGRVLYTEGGSGSCTVPLPGAQGSACFPLLTSDVNKIRALSFSSWPKKP